jgi:hypothetical protein
VHCCPTSAAVSVAIVGWMRLAPIKVWVGSRVQPVPMACHGRLAVPEIR